MAVRYPLRRFLVVKGEGDEEAQAYGPGAYCWTAPREGVQLLQFLTPTRYYMSEKWVEEHAQVEPFDHWTWNGDLDNPSLSPSILIKTRDGVSLAWREVFHGYIRNGYLEVL